MRTHGIDVPEAGQSCATPGGDEWRCGAIAFDRLAAAIGGALLDREALDRNQYGRIICRCRVDDEDIGAFMDTERLS